MQVLEMRKYGLSKAIYMRVARYESRSPGSCWRQGRRVMQQKLVE
jgi:hypothetical protein